MRCSIDFEPGGHLLLVFRLNLDRRFLCITVKLMDIIILKANCTGHRAMYLLPVIVTVLNRKAVVALVWFWKGAFLLLKHFILGLLRGSRFKRGMWVPLGFHTLTLSDCQDC